MGDAKGFNFYALGNDGRLNAILGDSIRTDKVKSLNAVSPLPGQYRLIHNGKPVKTSSIDGYEFTFAQPLEKGAYRIEVHLNIGGKYVPWIYSNPIYVY